MRWQLISNWHSDYPFLVRIIPEQNQRRALYRYRNHPAGDRNLNFDLAVIWASLQYVAYNRLTTGRQSSMGLWVFLLICGPVTALLYFPLTTRKQSFRLAPAGVSHTSAGPAPSTAKEPNVMDWTGGADDNHLRNWKSAA